MAHDDLAGGGRVRGQQAPVHVTSVAEVGVVCLLGAPLEDLRDELLALGWSLDEELDGCGEESQLNFDSLVVESSQIILQEAVRVLNAIRVLSNDPDDSGLCFGLVQVVYVLDDMPNDAFVLVGILAEDVANDDSSFLDNVGNFGADELEEAVDALSSCGLDFNGELSDGTNGLAHEMNVNFCGVPMSFVSFKQEYRVQERGLDPAYSLNSARTTEIFSLVVNMKINSSFVTLT